MAGECPEDNPEDNPGVGVRDAFVVDIEAPDWVFIYAPRLTAKPSLKRDLKITIWKHHPITLRA
jgi:hypothetical protein